MLREHVPDVVRAADQRVGTYEVVECDGPEDCSPGQTCCYTSSGAFCTGACLGAWSQYNAPRVVCHSSQDCPDAGACSPQAYQPFLLCP
jgi:hypothetical protein